MINFEPTKTAVIVLDIQNDFCADDGAFAKNLGWGTEQIRLMVPQLIDFVDQMRSRGLLIVFSQMVNSKEESPSNLQEKLSSGAESGAATWPFGLARGSQGYDFYQIQPQADDVVLEKKYYDIFSNAELLPLLKQHNIETIIVTGLYTEVCVFGAVERAFTEGYQVIVPSDLVASVDQRQSLRTAALEIMDGYLAHVAISRDLGGI